VLAGAFALLAVLADAEAELGLTEAARRAGLPKSTAHRLLEQLCGIGAAEHRRRGYGVGPLVGRLGMERGRLHARIGAAVGKSALRLAKLSRTDVVVCVLSGADVVVVATYAGHSARVPAVRPGAVLPPSTPMAGVLLNSAGLGPVEPPWTRQDQEPAGLSGAAAPIRDPDGRVVAAIGALNSSGQDLPWLRQLVMVAAVEAGRELAGTFA
jgi:DNA-binding IclR family transcriptional regulator